MVPAYNEPITFGLSGTAKYLNTTGIDLLEGDNESWTSAPVAELDIKLPFTRKAVVIELGATPFVIPDIVRSQQVFIYLGGWFVGVCSLVSHNVREFPIIRNITSGNAVRLSLVLPNTVSPHSLGLGDDRRELGICLTAISFKSSSDG